MKDKIEVKLDFINKKKKLKHVKFWMDKQTYEMLFDESIEEEIRHQYLIDEYHEYERERYHNRKYVSFDSEMAEALDLIEDIDIYREKILHKELIEAINNLTPSQKEIIIKVYFENKKQIEVAKELGVSKEYVSKTLSKSISTLRKIIKK